MIFYLAQLNNIFLILQTTLQSYTCLRKKITKNIKNTCSISNFKSIITKIKYRLIVANQKTKFDIFKGLGTFRPTHNENSEDSSFLDGII